MTTLLVLIPLLSVLLLNLPIYRVTKKLALPLAILVTLFEIASPFLKFIKVEEMSSLNIINFGFRVDGLSLIIILSAGVSALTAVLAGYATIKNEKLFFKFVNLLLLSLAGINGLVGVSDLFSIYVFIEIIAVSSYIMIALERTPEGLEGSFKYLILSSIATLLMISSTAFLFMSAGDTSFGQIAASIHENNRNILNVIGVLLFVLGLFIKGGLVPFHGWLPDAYSSAPSSVSIFIAGIVTKATGVYTLMRIVIDVFGISEELKIILLVVGAITIIIGALLALPQKEFKRLLAYSSISQVGYIIIGFGVGTELGIAGAIFHIFNHTLAKSLLFLNASAIEEKVGARQMDDLGGLSNKMPVTGFSSVIASLATAGVPPLSGFWSKLIIIIALFKSGNTTYAVIAILASILTLSYMINMQRKIFFGKLNEKYTSLKEANAWFLVPSILLTTLIILLGLLFPKLLDTFIIPIKSIL